jgi:hypothetical protein
MKALIVLLASAGVASAQPSCYRDITSDACAYELFLMRQLDDQRSAIELDARQRQSDRDFEAWVYREYDLNLNYPYPPPHPYRRQRR